VTGLVQAAPPILELRDLTVAFALRAGTLRPVEGIGLSVAAGETLALVGESGSGKSVTALAVMGLLPGRTGRIERGQVLFRTRDGAVVDLAALDREALRRLRGDQIGMVFQEPMTSLNPVWTVGDQVAEPLRVHRGLGRRQAAAQAVELLATVGIAEPARRAGQYPHELSGGMRQRAMIALALACKPRLLIADEPTTALDVTMQAQILDLMRRLQDGIGMGMIFVTHNLGVVAEIAQRVAVMYAGRVVEEGPVREVFRRPLHPYTAGLLASMPRLGTGAAARAGGGTLRAIPGSVPSLAERPAGCAFAPRCALARPACRAALPPAVEAAAGRLTRCIRWDEL